MESFFANTGGANSPINPREMARRFMICSIGMRPSRNDSQRHELRMGIGPLDGVALRFEEPVDHEGVFLLRSSSTKTGRFTTHHGRPGIDGDAGCVRKDNFAS